MVTMKKVLLLCFLIAFGCPLMAQVINTESFDGTTFPPTGWTLGGANPTYLFRVTAGTQPTQSPHSGAGELEFNSFNLNGGNAALISPIVDLSNVGSNTATVSLWF